jgi:alpha-1,3-mannosyltransferase
VQYIFLGFYLATQAVVLLLYQAVLDSKKERQKQQQQSQTQQQSQQQKTTSCSLATAHYIWSWRLCMACVCLSKRMHSIYMLRLFNDGPTMLLLYLSMLLFLHHRWNMGCFIFSLAVSCKMNVLLFAPGLLLLLLQVGSDFWNSVVLQRLLLCCALPQVLLGAPFLLRFPESYLRKAFELDRVFFYQWTVNFKFLPEEMFISKPWALMLLACHLGTLCYLLTFRWLQQTAQEQQRLCNTTTTTTTTTTMTRNQQQKPPQVLFIQDKQLSAEYIAYTLVVSNFVGIVFARTLHYQFYVRRRRLLATQRQMQIRSFSKDYNRHTWTTGAAHFFS